MILEPRLCGILSQKLSERPLVLRRVALENAWCDPRLKDKPATGVHATNFLSVVIEGRCALRELLCLSVLL